jgi:signal transduction protein with GAF and PtsI domain
MSKEEWLRSYEEGLDKGLKEEDACEYASEHAHERLVAAADRVRKERMENEGT